MGGVRTTTGSSDEDPEPTGGPDAGTPETGSSDAAASVDQVIEESDHDTAEQRTLKEEEIFPAYDEAGEERSRLNPIQRFMGQRDTVSDADKQTVRIEIPTRTIIKVIVTLVVIWLVLKVASIFLLLLLAIIVCLALLPVVRRLEHRGMPRGVAVITVFAGLIGIIAGFLWLIVPPLVTQTQTMVDNAPTYIETFDDILDRYPSVRDQVDAYLGTGEADPEQAPVVPEQDSAIEDAPVPAVDAGTVQAGATQVLSISTAIIGALPMSSSWWCLRSTCWLKGSARGATSPGT